MRLDMPMRQKNRKMRDKQIESEKNREKNLKDDE